MYRGYFKKVVALRKYGRITEDTANGPWRNFDPKA